jgi:hypothetical protein
MDVDGPAPNSSPCGFQNLEFASAPARLLVVLEVAVPPNVALWAQMKNASEQPELKQSSKISRGEQILTLALKATSWCSWSLANCTRK